MAPGTSATPMIPGSGRRDFGRTDDPVRPAAAAGSAGTAGFLGPRPGVLHSGNCLWENTVNTIIRKVIDFLVDVRQFHREQAARIHVKNVLNGHQPPDPVVMARASQVADAICEQYQATLDCLSPLMDREQAVDHFVRAAARLHHEGIRRIIARRLEEKPEVRMPAVWLEFGRESSWYTHILEEPELLDGMDEMTLADAFRWAYYRVTGHEPGKLVVLITFPDRVEGMIAVSDYIDDPRDEVDPVVA
jgi:hypothetical protein